MGGGERHLVRESGTMKGMHPPHGNETRAQTKENEEATRRLKRKPNKAARQNEAPQWESRRGEGAESGRGPRVS